VNGQKHIINRQVLELTIPERSRAQSIQNKTSEIVKYKLQPALDNLFSKITTADEIVRIDKLVIDLGVISENEIEKFLVEKCLIEIGNKINRLKISGKTNSLIKPMNGHSIDFIEKFKTTSKSKDLLEQFVYFLQFGRFPWWHHARKSSAKTGAPQLEEIFEEVLKLDKTVFKSSIIPLLINPSVRKRLIFQFSHSQLDELLKRLDNNLFESCFSMFQILFSNVKSVQNRNDLSKSFYKIALKFFGSHRELKNDDLKIRFVKELLGVFFNKYSIKEIESILIEILESFNIQQSRTNIEVSGLTVVAVVQAAIELRSQNQVLQKVINDILLRSEAKVQKLIEQHLKLINKESGEVNKNIDPKPVKKPQNYLPENNDAGGKKVQSSKKNREENQFSAFSSKSTEEAEGISVSNAGLVLLHPFLRYFFDGLGLLDKELHFKSRTEVFKAIHLLQYVVSENKTTEETELTLNKILCGLDIDEPVPNSFPLKEAEKEECMNLIKTVLERWNALRTANPAALRDTYLQREGVLKQSGQSWNLTIERNSFDVMLEKLPWSVSLIKLPWLSQIIYVEW
jgi:hypothetical protein